MAKTSLIYQSVYTIFNIHHVKLRLVNNVLLYDEVTISDFLTVIRSNKTNQSISLNEG